MAIWNEIGMALGGAADAVNQYRRQSTLADLGASLQGGDYKSAAQRLIASGDLHSGISLLRLGEDQDKLRAQREADKEAFSLVSGGAPAAQPASAPPANVAAAAPANDEVSRYIADAARARGIDPGVALRVYASEGKRAYVGDNGSSFGPFQLHYGGVAPGGNRVAGMGDDFTRATGLDARDQSTWRQQVDFALDNAAKGGWGPWHGAAKVGIGDRQGIGAGQPVQVADASGGVPIGGGGDQTETRIQNLTRALSNPNISQNARQILSLQLQEAERRRMESRQDADRAERRQERLDVRAARQQELDLKRQERADAVEKQTGEQANAATFATRMNEAEKIISDPRVYGSALGNKGRINEIAGKIPLFGTSMQDEQFQRYDQARRDFINAVLRKESGAAIGAAEFENAEKQYFPVPGNPPSVIAQKAKNRATAIETIAQGGNNTFRKAFSEKRAEQTQGGPSVGAVEDGYRFKGGDPSKPESWERAQ
jgi:hypothetical protein